MYEKENKESRYFLKNLLLLENIFPLQKSVRLVGVTVGTLNTDNNNDFLFPQMQKQKNLEETIYNINKKFGAFCVKPMSLMVCEKYGLEKNCGMVNKELLKGS